MTNSTQNRAISSVVATAVLCLLAFSGCEEKYKPAAYKAAPRVDSGDSGSSEESAGRVTRLPDVTDWTSPDAIKGDVRKFPAPVIGGGGYRGDSYRGDSYRGYAKRGYAGIARGYRGYGSKGQRAYRGYGKSSAYRGYDAQRSYRGYKSGQPESKYRGYQR